MTARKRTGSMCAAAARVRSSGVKREDLRDKRREVVVGQVVERELGRRARDLLGGLEPSRVSARQRRPSELQLLGRDRPFAAYRAQLAERLSQGVGGGVRLHARLQRRTGPRPRLNSKLVRAP